MDYRKLITLFFSDSSHPYRSAPLPPLVGLFVSSSVVIFQTFLVINFGQVLLYLGSHRLKQWKEYKKKPRITDVDEETRNPENNVADQQPSSSSAGPSIPTTNTNANNNTASQTIGDGPDEVGTETLVSCVKYGTPALKQKAQLLFLKKFLTNDVAVNLVVLDLLSSDMTRRLKALETLFWPCNEFKDSMAENFTFTFFKVLVKSFISFTTLPVPQRTDLALLCMIKTLDLIEIQLQLLESTDFRVLPDLFEDSTLDELATSFSIYQRNITYPEKWTFENLVDVHSGYHNPTFESCYSYATTLTKQAW